MPNEKEMLQPKAENRRAGLRGPTALALAARYFERLEKRAPENRLLLVQLAALLAHLTVVNIFKTDNERLRKLQGSKPQRGARLQVDTPSGKGRR